MSSRAASVRTASACGPAGLAQASWSCPPQAHQPAGRGKPGCQAIVHDLPRRAVLPAAVHRGWNNELDFRVSPELAAELAALPEPERKTHERKERNKQSASAARAKRCASPHTCNPAWDAHICM